MNRWLLAAAIFFLIAAIGRCTPKDSTDPPDGRSGLGLRIDHMTGCQYLTAHSLLGETSITPRLDENGRHICNPRGTQ